MLRLVLTAVLVIWIDRIQPTEADASSTLPSVLWSQFAGSWSKVQGVLGDPSQLINENQLNYSYVSTQPQKLMTESFGVNQRTIDYNPIDNTVYWSDSVSVSGQSWGAAMLWSSNASIFRFQAVSSWKMFGITVDWFSDTVYATESTTGNIVAVKMMSSGVSDGSEYRIVAAGGVIPTAIRSDPNKGLLFWTDTGPNSQSIKSSTMMGSNVTTLVNLSSTAINITGLALDVSNQRLYWVQSDTSNILTCAYDGSGIQVLYAGSPSSSHRSVAVYQNYILVATEYDLQISIHSKQNGSLRTSFDIDAYPYDIAAAMQTFVTPPPAHPCQTMGCEMFCTNLGNNQGVCQCQVGFYLALDGVSCLRISPRYISSTGSLIFMSDVTILSTDRLTLTQSAIKTNAFMAQALGFDVRQQFVYYSDTALGSVFRMNDTGEHVITLTVQQPRVEGIIVNWRDSIIFWTDYNLGHIMAFQPDGRYHRQVIVNRTKPMGISLDPTTGLLYWCEDSPTRTIYRAHMDGTGVESFHNLIDAPSCSSPLASTHISLVVDTYTKRLYWSDPCLQTLNSINLQTNEVHIIWQTSSWQSLYGTTVYQQYMTWTNGSQNLQFGDMATAQILVSNEIQVNPHGRLTVPNHAKSYDIVTYDTYLQPTINSSDSCLNNSCGQHCYSLPSGGHTCACSIGYRLNSDGKTCNSDVVTSQFLLFSDPYHKQIYQLQPALNGSGVQGVKVPIMDFPVSIELDTATGLIYWIDSMKNEIKSSDTQGRNFNTLYSIPADSRPIRLAIHSPSKRLYYTDFQLGAIFAIDVPTGNNHQMIVSGLNSPLAIVLNQSSSVMYWSEGPTVSSMTTDTKVNQTLGTQFGNITCLSIHMNDPVLYMGDINQGQIFSVNVSANISQVIYSSTQLEIYAIAAGADNIYFAAWNQKGIYQLAKAQNGTSAILMAYPIYARITDLKYIDSFVLLSAEALPIALIVGLTVGLFFLLLLLLLLCLLLALFFLRRKKPKKVIPVRPLTTVTNDGSDPFDVIGNGSTIPRIVIANANDTIMPVNPKVRPALMRLSSGFHKFGDMVRRSIVGDPNIPDELGSETDLITTTSDASYGRKVAVLPLGGASNSNGYQYDQDDQVPSASGAGRSTDEFGGPVSPVGSPRRAVPGSLPHNVIGVTLRPTPPKPPPVPDTTGFDIKNKNVATVVQRLAKRLRTGISTLRGVPVGASGSGSATYGRTPSGASPPEDVVVGGTDPDQAEAIGPEKTKRPPTSRYVYIPPYLHKQPRGCKPASNFTPVQLKTTWGRHKKTEAAEVAAELAAAERAANEETF